MLQRFHKYWTLVSTLLVCASALAQTSRISGHITDPQTLSVPDGLVHAVNLDTGATYDTKTNGSGEYTIPYVTAGRYQVGVRAQGFNTALSNDIRLDVGQLFVYDVQLTVGTTTSTVNVDAGSSVTQVETQSAEVSGTITGKEVAGIQLNGRNFTQLIAMTPGVSNQTQQDEAKVGQAGSVAYSVNGGRTEYNSFSVDGSETLNVGINKDHSTLIVYPSIDAIQEIQVLTSNYGAQSSSTGNAITIVTTRSGTDSLHGNLYEFFRNEAFNAKGYFDVINGAPLYRRNDFGGTLAARSSYPGSTTARAERTSSSLKKQGSRLHLLPTDKPCPRRRSATGTSTMFVLRSVQFSRSTPSPFRTVLFRPAESRTIITSLTMR